ncbi:peptide ABC transporter permease [Sulfolobales archaeon HS-7]|nr:peptide ABC transporter permease [Sulfolobales archaeon HS-7]
MNSPYKQAISKTLAIVIALLVIVAAIGVAFYIQSVSPHTISPITSTTSSTQSTTSQTYQYLSPSNSSVLIDVAQTVPPSCLDPATDFLDEVEPLFFAIYQQLVEPNGSNYMSVVPVLAQNYTVSPNYQNYTFYIRPYAKFSNGMPVNASDVWFSIYRAILMNQPAGAADYICILYNGTQSASTGFALPYGIEQAIENVTGIHTIGNASLTATILSNILSNFNPTNSTIMKIMEYPYQAVVVKGNYTVQFNTLEPYRFFLLDIAGTWGAIVYPAFVDQHGGVVPNQPNNYADLHGLIGSGPYVISSVSEGFSTIVIKANPNYWAIGHNVPPEAEPPHIPIIEIDYGFTHVQRVEDFDKNQAQISYVGVPYIGQVVSGYPYKLPLSDILVDFGSTPGVQTIGMNTEKYPLNITDLRLAILHAINYSQLMSLYSYNGTTLASLPLGPISPQYGAYYNPDNLSFYTYNVSLALRYLNEAGYQGSFYVVLPNGSTIGDTNGVQLKPLTVVTLAPISELQQEELDVVSADLEQIGISISVMPVTFSVLESYTTPLSSPNMEFIGWTPDWPDPILQQMMPLTDINFGGPGGNAAWFNNSYLQQIYAKLPFITNESEQINLIAKAYNVIYNSAPYVWLPVPYSYYFVQPYVKNTVFTVADGYLIYFYNTMQYEPFNVTS